MKLIHLVLIWNETKGLQIANLKILEDDDPLGGFEWSKNDFWKKSPPLFCYTCQKPEIVSQSNMPKSTLKVRLDEQTFYSKILS